jgi:hypothetical protein
MGKVFEIFRQYSVCPRFVGFVSVTVFFYLHVDGVWTRFEALFQKVDEDLAALVGTLLAE